ncbi:hypothetical protein [Dechloromonas denitrificans]|uniref:hypothetical protein n=1 Tax=Dechloromonas denitrificans TaxID=281362 RepID=UPI001CF854C4|nr:hypothetical protein [Dechloromonas denitrificans]UCV05062.1 hypothetical protein KI611_07375 [Dechloromonas denitrificans]
MFDSIKKLFFSGRAKRLLSYADGISEVALLTVYMSITTYISSQNPGLDRNRVAQRAAAWTNYLFGSDSSDRHSNLNLDYEYAKAVQWLDDDSSGLQELVIQGLRIKNTVYHARTGTAELKGADLLKVFGSRYPDAPDLDKYAASVHLSMWASLTSEQRDEVFNYIRTGPYAKYFKGSKSFGWD